MNKDPMTVTNPEGNRYCLLAQVVSSSNPANVQQSPQEVTPGITAVFVLEDGQAVLVTKGRDTFMRSRDVQQNADAVLDTTRNSLPKLSVAAKRGRR